jgi:hypothetical protein
VKTPAYRCGVGGGTPHIYNSNISCGFIRNGLGFARWPNSGSENNCANNYWGREPKLSTPLA